MIRMTYFVMALALVLGFTQCKKEQTNNQDTESHLVPITLTVGSGTRAVVDPVYTNPGTGETYASVAFENGDVIHVGFNNKCVGTLTYNGSNFTGSITLTSEDEQITGQYLHFYFLGGLGFTSTLNETNTEATVVISDQSSKYPVISYAPSSDPYTGGGAYSATLKSKCSIMKFNVNTPSTSAICITGMNNKVTLTFNPEAEETDDGFTYGMDGNGVIKMHGVTSSNTETWAIVLPQDELPAGEEGSVYTYDNAYIGTRPAMGEIVMNTYSNSGFALEVTTSAAPVHEYVDLGLPSGLLWATCNVGADAPEEYGDYFAWGETQTKTNYNWSKYQYCNGSSSTLTKYCNKTNYGYNSFTDDLTTLLPGDDAATANWGSDWRMPTEAEWQELFSNTTRTWTQQGGVYGRRFTATNGSGNSLFLPAAGNRKDGELNYAGSMGYYWSSSLNTGGQPYNACRFYFDSGSASMNSNGNRYYGQSVRAVRSAPQN